MPHPIWRSKAGAMNLIRQGGNLFIYSVACVDLAGPLTAVSFITEIRGTVFYEGRKVGRVVFL